MHIDMPTLHFARFRATDWTALLSHAKQLAGAEYVGIFSEGIEGNTRIEFDLRLYHFTVEQDGRSHVVITVDSDNCDQPLLHYVQNHFDELLTREFAA